MKLLGKDINAIELLEQIERRLRARGLSGEPVSSAPLDGVEPRVDPLSFNLTALEEHADPTRPLPLHTHRGGFTGRALLLAKWAFRNTCQIFINEALARQRVFNGHVRDSYAQLSAEVLKLRKELDARSAAEPEKKTPAQRKKTRSPRA